MTAPDADRVVSLMVWLYTCGDRCPVLRRPFYWLGDSVGKASRRLRGRAMDAHPAGRAR